MDGNRKRFSFGWYTGVLLGVTFSGAVVYAVTLPHTFTDGSTASAAQVNANFAALSAAIDGCATDMVRVGASCVDTAAQYITAAPGAGCSATGAGCAAGTLTVGTTAATPPISFSWGQAVAACTNAGKRLATGREIIAGANAGAFTVDDGSFLYVDASAARGPGDAYAGTHIRPTGGVYELLGTQTAYTEGFTNVAFRCAR